jgi:hypothetical protein
MREPVPVPWGSFLAAAAILIALAWVALKTLKFLLSLV